MGDTLESVVALPILVWHLFQNFKMAAQPSPPVYIAAKTHFGSFLISELVVLANFN